MPAVAANNYLFGVLIGCFHIFYGGREHQLDSVELIYLTGTRIVVYGYDVCLRITASEFLDNTFSNDVVWKAAKWLDADDVRCTVMNQFQHLTGKEPAFTGHIADGNDWRCHFGKLCDVSRRCKVFTFGKFLGCSTSDEINGFDAELTISSKRRLKPKIFGFEI